MANTYGEHVLAYQMKPDGSVAGRRNFAKLDGVTKTDTGVTSGADGLIWRMSEVTRSDGVALHQDRIATPLTRQTGTLSNASAGPLGAGMTCPTSPITRPQIDAAAWCRALQGTAELTSGSNSVGAMVGGRGCVESLPDNEYMITVAWQGLSPVSAPPASVACGQSAYDEGGSVCTQDRCRRVVTTIVRIATLSGSP